MREARGSTVPARAHRRKCLSGVLSSELPAVQTELGCLSWETVGVVLGTGMLVHLL